MLVKDAQVAETAARERTILEALRHPFVVDLVGCFQSPGACYFLLEYVPGGELFSLVSRRGMGEAGARFFAACAAEVLEHVHDAGYVFRDLKPENVESPARDAVLYEANACPRTIHAAPRPRNIRAVPRGGAATPLP